MIRQIVVFYLFIFIGNVIIVAMAARENLPNFGFHEIIERRDGYNQQQNFKEPHRGNRNHYSQSIPPNEISNQYETEFSFDRQHHQPRHQQAINSRLSFHENEPVNGFAVLRRLGWSSLLPPPRSSVLSHQTTGSTGRPDTAP